MPRQMGSVTVKAAYIMAAGAVIAAIITGIVLLVTSQPVIQTTVSGQNNTTVTQTGADTVHITNTQGISEDRFQKLAEELGVTKTALNSFFKIIEQRAVPPEDLDSTLRTIAERYKALDEKLKTFTSDDPIVQALKEQARQALEAGKFDRAEQLLNKASEKDFQAIQQIQRSTEELETIIEKNKVVIRKRKLSAAASKAENGDLKYTQLAYGEAAAYYQQAAELVPTNEQSILADYLNGEGVRLVGGRPVYESTNTPGTRFRHSRKDPGVNAPRCSPQPQQSSAALCCPKPVRPGRAAFATCPAHCRGGPRTRAPKFSSCAEKLR